MRIKGAAGREGGRAVGELARTSGVALFFTALLFTALPPYRLTAQAPSQGPSYWQQSVRYTIRAALDEPSGTLAAAAQLVYRNNSPDTLRELNFHLYLNAFRPGSLWSRDEQREGIERFAALPEPYSAFEELRRVRIGEAELAIEYPGAPDSTVARVLLPRPLRPGDSLVVSLEWRARPSAIPRRQGRRGRRFDFAQWYPKVCVYDRNGWQAHPLRLAGELYGEFGTYDVTLDLAEDQVVAATGVPAAGDPGWSRAAANASGVTLQADWYGARSRPGVMEWQSGLQPGRRRVRFYAENIHHFAFSLNPQYRYEEGRYGNVVLRTLYLPGDSATWGGGVVIERTRRAMAWLDTIFGTYPYPQTVVLHRIEGGGTEFPMLVMNGGPDESLIFHEVGHIYTYGILANNEWKEGWLDEGFTTFQTGWNFQRRGMGVPSTQTQQLILNMDLDGWSEPVSQVSENYREFGIYNRMIYTKGQLIYEMLRYHLGEEAFRRALRLYYDRWKLKHVDEAAFRRVLEEVSGQNLQSFFTLWLHRSPPPIVDYGLGEVVRGQVPGGGWRTSVEVRRYGDGIVPVDIALPVGDTVYMGRASGGAVSEVVVITTPGAPGPVTLDPDRRTMDWNYLNNHEVRKFFFFTGAGGPPPERRLGWSGSQPARRDRTVLNWMPTAWYNDAGGLTVGFQQRGNYLGRFDQYVSQVAWATRQGFPEAIDFYVAMRNPRGIGAPRLRWGIEAWELEGRVGARGGMTVDASRHLTYGPRRSLGWDVAVMDVQDAAFTDTARWDDLYTVEASAFFASRWTGPGRATDLRVGVGVGFGGVMEGQASRENRVYLRSALELKHRRPLGPVEARGRFYAASAVHLNDMGVPNQRMVFLAGADPYETMNNPFLRSRGALFVRRDVNYATAGGAGLRGYDANLAADWALAGNVEVSRQLFRRPLRRAFNGVAVAAFLDAAFAGNQPYIGSPPFFGTVVLDRLLADAGVGIRATHRIGPTSFVTRVDFPFLVSEPTAAVSASPLADGRAKFRLVWSLEEAF